MVGHLLLRGMLVGVVAGLLAFGFARMFGEPSIERAIAFEAQMSQGGPAVQGHSHSHDHADQAAHDHAHPSDHAKGQPEGESEAELVSRGTQAGLGLLTGVAVYGAAIGGLFALAFAFVHGRVGDQGPRATAALLALAGFVAIVLVPAIKYPANPPAVGDPATIGARTALFFIMLALSVAALAAAVALARALRAHFGAWNAALIAGAAFVVTIAAVQYALPEVNEVPERFSAVVLWRFRVASLGMHLVLWTTIGLLFGFLTERAAGRRAS
jgi:predicted cobalt transporter CbtA